MYTDEQLDKLEQEEHEITLETIALMLLLVNSTRNNLEKELRSFYQKYGKDGVVTYQEARKWVSGEDHRRRLTALLLFVGDEFTTLHSQLEPEFKSVLEKVIGIEGNFFDVDLDVEKILNTKWGLDDAIWSERLTDDCELWSDRIASDLKQSILKRETVDGVLEQLDKRFDSINSVLEKLVLTESTSIGSLGRKDAFKELGASKYKFYSRPDERRCEHCGSLHGLIFPMSAFEVGVTASPIHPRCRCWEVPILDE